MPRHSFKNFIRLSLCLIWYFVIRCQIFRGYFIRHYAGIGAVKAFRVLNWFESMDLKQSQLLLTFLNFRIISVEMVHVRVWCVQFSVFVPFCIDWISTHS